MAEKPSATAKPPESVATAAPTDPTLETLETLQQAFAILSHIRAARLLLPGQGPLFEKMTSVILRARGVFTGWGVEFTDKIISDWEQAIPLPPVMKMPIRQPAQMTVKVPPVRLGPPLPARV